MVGRLDRKDNTSV